jgi:hypothetical protein
MNIEFKSKQSRKSSLYDLFKDPTELIKDSYSKSSKIDKSISNTLNDSSLELSPNSSGILLLDHIAELKKLFELQSKEIENVGQVINSQKNVPDRLKDMLGSLHNGAESLTTSIVNQNSLINFQDISRQIISPVPQNFGNSDFASSLMEYSDYQAAELQVKTEKEECIGWLNGRFRGLKFLDKGIVVSHIPCLRI